MIIQSLQATDFMRFTQFALDDLPDTGLIGIFGDNECGKSSIGELICFCLFGRTTKAPDGDPERVIRWGCDACEAQIHFAVGHESFRIIRRLQRDGMQEGRLVNMSADSLITAEPADIESHVAELLNYSFKEFRYSTYIAQNELDIILHSADDRRDVLNNMLGVGFMDKMADRAVDRRKEQEDLLASARQRIEDKQEVLDVYKAREEDLKRIDDELDKHNHELLAALKERDQLVSTSTLLEEIKRKSEKYEVLDARISNRREKLKKLEAQASALIRETDRIPALISENKEKEAMINDLATSSMQELEDKLAKIDEYRELMKMRDDQLKLLERREADLSKLTDKLEIYAEKDEAYKKATQELTSIEFFLEAFTGETRYRTMISSLMKDIDLLETELDKVGAAFSKDLEVAREKKNSLEEQVARVRRQKEATAIDEVTSDQLATLQTRENAVVRKRDMSLGGSAAFFAAGVIVTLIAGNVLFLLIAAPIAVLLPLAYSLNTAVHKARQLLMTAQQKFYAYNITQRGLQELEDSIVELNDRIQAAQEDVEQIEEKFDSVHSLAFTSFAELEKSADVIRKAEDKHLERALGIMEEILTGYDNLRSLVAENDVFDEISKRDPATLLVDKESRKAELQKSIKQLSGELEHRGKFVEQSESYIKEIREQRDKLAGLERSVQALGVTDEDEPGVQKEIQKLDFQIEQLKREIKENLNEVKRIQNDAEEAGLIETKRQELINEIDADLIQFYELREATRDIDCSDERFVSLQEQLNKAEETVAECRQTVTGLDAQRKIIQKDLERVADVYEEIKGLDDECSAIENQALKYRELENLFVSTGLDIKKRLIPQIESYFAWIMPRMTRGRYHQIRISNDFDISVYSEEKEDYVNLDSLSGGTLDQLLIALRLAFARAATSSTYYPNQFLFLDEPISSFDESRRELFFSLLETLKQGFQQIFLISHLPNLEEFVDSYLHVTLQHEEQPAAISWK